MPSRLTKEEFIAKAHKVHKGFYTYLKVIYTQSKAKVIITCPTHGDFYQEANSHLQGKGCSKCRSANIQNWRVVPFDKVIKEAKAKHSNKYSYKTTPYKNQSSILTIECPIHGIFYQKARDHLDGCGCQKCANDSRNSKFTNEPTLLYYIYFPFLQLFKIGITRTSVYKRYSGEEQSYIIVHTEKFNNGKDAYIKEQQILRKFKDNRYKGVNPFKLGGHTECFTKDILGLYYKGKLNE